MKYHIAVLAYGTVPAGPGAVNPGPYTEMFLANFMKSLLDETNLPLLKREGHDVTVTIYTDLVTSKLLEKDERLKPLESLCKVDGVCLVEKFSPGQEYSALQQMNRHAIIRAKQEGAALSVLASDMVFAKGFFSKIINRYIDGGHDAIFSIPIRASNVDLHQWFQGFPGAPDSIALFDASYARMHSLWKHAHWNSPQFSSIPYCIVWNTCKGLSVRAFSISPLLFHPHEELIQTGTLDLDAPRLFKNPYWAEDWLEVPVAGIEPPKFDGAYMNAPATTDFVGRVFTDKLHESQIPYLRHPFYYPSKAVAGTSKDEEANKIAEEIIAVYETKKAAEVK